jgi:hypothetical protein
MHISVMAVKLLSSNIFHTNCRIEVYPNKCYIHEDTKYFQVSVASLQYNF